MKNFGLQRVISPKGVLPVSAWKLDNSTNLRSGEARMAISRIQIEHDSFNQICASCDYGVEKIKDKILDIVEKRGKLQNPYTKTGGVLMGEIIEVGVDFDNDLKVTAGDPIYCICSTCSVPVKLEKIHKIDFQYGQISCQGSAILFETTPLRRKNQEDEDKFILYAMNEAGNLYGLWKIVERQEINTALVIGNDVKTLLLYAQTLREGMRSDGELEITAVIDSHAHGKGEIEGISTIFEGVIDQVNLVDLVQPIKATESIMPLSEIHQGKFDQVVVIDDVYGAESLAVSMVKSKGHVFFASAGSQYWTAAITAEGLGKEVNMQVFDQYAEEHPEFTFMLVEKLSEKLRQSESLFKETSGKNSLNKTATYDRDVGRAGEKGDFVFKSPVTRKLVDDVVNIAKYDCSVILQGETGVGKEKILKLIHENSTRRSGPCIKINCATIHENLAESEFFGYEKGAFTGAGEDGKRGYFEMANNGILFLDEIGSLPLSMQSKFLRVVQESRFYRVGGSSPIDVNVRVIVANNEPLKQLVKEGKFRKDLFYRLDVCTVDVPPLRERREDIMCIAEALVDDWAEKYSITKNFDAEALRVLYLHQWQGNVRELENVVHRLVISSTGETISKEDVIDILYEEDERENLPRIRKPKSGKSFVDFNGMMEEQERTLITYALNEGKTTRKAAAILGIPQTTLARKKNKYGL